MRMQIVREDNQRRSQAKEQDEADPFARLHPGRRLFVPSLTPNEDVGTDAEGQIPMAEPRNRSERRMEVFGYHTLLLWVSRTVSICVTALGEQGDRVLTKICPDHQPCIWVPEV